MSTIFVLLFFFALFGIFKPFIAGTKRRHFALAAFAFFVAIGVTAPKSANQKYPETQDEPPGEAVLKATNGPKQNIDHSVALNSFQSSVTLSMKPCDQSSQRLANVAAQISKGRSSIYDGYAAASDTKERCRESWSAVSDLEAPESLPSAAFKKAEETLERCEGAMLAKQMAADKMAEIFDGNLRPSAVQEAKELADGAQAGILGCAAGFFLVANEAGVDIKKLKLGKSE